MAGKEQIIVATKADAVQERERVDALRDWATARDLQYFEISAVSGKGLQELITAIATRLERTGREYLDPSGPLDVHVHLGDVRAIRIDGSGDCVASDPIRADELDVGVFGSGDVYLYAIEAEQVDAEVMGSGDVVLEGIARKATFRVQGSGDITAGELDTNIASVRIHGSGDVVVAATVSLQVEISGSGDVEYVGSPEIQSSIHGSGSITRY